MRVQAAGWYWHVYMFGIGAAVMMGYLCAHVRTFRSWRELMGGGERRWEMGER